MSRLKLLWLRFKAHCLKKVANCFPITLKGLYLFSYIARKYINLEEIDEIQCYEEPINQIEQDLHNANYFKYMYEKDPNLPQNKEMQHAFAAVLYASILYKATDKESKEKCLNMIELEENKQRFLNLQKIRFLDF